MRNDQIKTLLAGGIFAVAPNYLNGLLTAINDGVESIEAKHTDNTIDPTHSYAKVGNVAVISVDGAMMKKNTNMNAMCGGFVAYDTILAYIDEAENDSAIDTMFFRVDTAGGDVSGVDAVGERIYSSKLKTVTFYDNLGASAGIWAFSASDVILANETAMLGSIGVMATYNNVAEDKSTIVMTSKNAPNKNCSLSGDCKSKIESRIDKTEDIFHARVMRNRDMTRDQIVTDFNGGDVIFASEALENGFISGIMTFQDALSMHTKASMPVSTIAVASKIVEIQTKDDNMDNPIISQSDFDAVTANLTTATATIETLTAENESLVTQLSAKTEIVALGLSHGLSKDTLVSMMGKQTVAEASVIALSAMGTTGNVAPQVDVEKLEAEKQDAEDKAMLAYATKNKGSING